MSNPERDETGREADGRFGKGNRGGPGDPLAGQVAALRAAVIGAFTADELRKLMRSLYERALDGDKGAARLLLSYTVGKPPVVTEADWPAANPTGVASAVPAPADAMAAAVREAWERGDDPPDSCARLGLKTPFGDGDPSRATARDGGKAQPRPVLGGVLPVVGPSPESLRLIAQEMRDKKVTDRGKSGN